MKPLKLMAGAAMLALIASCAHNVSKETTKSGLDPENFKTVVGNDSTALYVLTNSNGMEVCITNFGGRVVSVMVPDKNGDFKDVVLGFDSISDYLPEHNLSDFGASIGRYANRIRNGEFALGSDTIRLPRNNFGHSLHGGGEMGDLGWQYRIYKAVQPNDSTLELTLDSPDGDNNYPGHVQAKVTYRLTSDNAIDIACEAVTDRPTVINMTHHGYFNLGGDFSRPVTDDIIQINASAFTPVDSTYIPTGEILPVAGTPMDFTKAKKVGEEIADFDFVQLKNGNGYDHNYVLDTKGDISKPAAIVYSPASGIRMEMFTTEPGVQFYSGNFLDGTLSGKGGVKLNQRTGLCLEPQHYPDSPNHPEWPSTVLNPGETYNSRIIYKFSVGPELTPVAGKTAK